jgi:hypothetical protein
MEGRGMNLFLKFFVFWPKGNPSWEVGTLGLKKKYFYDKHNYREFSVRYSFINFNYFLFRRMIYIGLDQDFILGKKRRFGKKEKFAN